MADVSITASSVTPGAGAVFYDGIAGATITAGQTVYIDSSASNTLKLADADAQASAACVGIATHGAAAGQPLRVQRGGYMNLTGMTKGTAYFVSTTAGGICPAGDLTTGDFPTLLGIAASATSLKMSINVLGVAI